MAKKVFIGVGHGGSDPGAVAFGREEADLNLSIALACRDELERHGVQVLMSRTKDENDALTEEIRECNNYGPDLAIDIHNNAGAGDGAEAFYYHGGGLSKTMASNVLAEIVKIGQNSRGIKTKLNSSGDDYFGFIRETVAPATIVETCFLDNSNDVKIIDTEAERKTMGVAIAKGILATLGIAYKAPTTTGKTATLNSVNGTRWDNYLVLYVSRTSTGTNKWGTEVPLDAQGVALSDPVSGVGNMKLPTNGYVLSGIGKGAEWIKANVRKGTKLKFSVSN